MPDCAISFLALQYVPRDRLIGFSSCAVPLNLTYQERVDTIRFDAQTTQLLKIILVYSRVQKGVRFPKIKIQKKKI